MTMPISLGISYGTPLKAETMPLHKRRNRKKRYILRFKIFMVNIGISKINNEEK